MTLADLPLGAPARVLEVETPDAVLYRLMEMGLIPGAEVSVEKVAPFGDPLELRVFGYALSIRRAEARRIRVEPRR